MIVLEFVEPHPTGGTCYVQIDPVTATKHQKEYALQYHNYIYNNDLEALDDFIALHWAQPVIRKGGVRLRDLPLCLSNVCTNKQTGKT